MRESLDDETFRSIKQDLVTELESLIDGMVIDPRFKYTIESVEAIEREAAFPTDVSLVFSITIRTNNRGILLGQATPFKPGDYKGYYNNLYAGYLIQFLEREYDLQFRYSVGINAVSEETTDKEGADVFDRELPLATALEAGIVTPESRLVEKMNEYNLTSLVLGGGTLISGPLPGPIESLEEVISMYDIESILDLFCGSGSFTKVALANGVTSATCLDLDLDSARENLREHEDDIRFEEGDAFDFTPTESYDLVLADPYFHLVPAFIDQEYPSLSQVANKILLTAGFREDRQWIEEVERRISKHSTVTERIDTGRTVQILSHHDA